MTPFSPTILVGCPELSASVIIPFTVHPGPLIVTMFPETVPVPDWLRLGADQVKFVPLCWIS